MTESQSISLAQVGKLAALASLSLALNYLIQKALKPKGDQRKTIRVDRSQADIPRSQSMNDLLNDQQLKSKDLWGSLQLDNVGEDALLQELEIMTKIVCPFVKVNNLIADLQLHNPKTFPCPLLAHSIKRKHDQPFLMPEALVPPGEFVIENCVFRAGQSVETEKKFMRAGPRATQYFDPKTVRADVVCLGKVCPGVNNIIRQLAILLKEIYHAEVVTGIKFGFKGYYTSNMIDLTPQFVETIHHRGGCFLGVSRAPFLPEKIVDSLVARGVNQLYLIGGNDTIKHTIELYKEIKRRHLNIAICVNLKAINKDTAYFDTCFGFESAVEETQRFIEEGYALSKSNFNSVVLVKVPGRYSGFLAMDAVRAARNANICLVPEFSFDLYGENGLLRYVAERVKLKGYCIIVYSEGASYAARDIPTGQYQQILRRKEESEQSAFDIFFKQQVERELKQREFNPFNVYLFDSQNAVRTVPANSFDTKLCCQIALCSIQGLMCGYTNFAIGHLKNRVAMVPIEQMISADKYCLRPYEEHWQRLLATTGQPSFLNQEHQLQH